MDDGTKFLALLLAVVFAASGACAYVITNTVECEELCVYVERRFDPAHVNVWYSYHCISQNAKTGNCTASIPIRHEDHIPDRWFVTWLEVDDSRHEERVPKDFYDWPPKDQTHRHRRWKECRRSRH